MPICLARFRFAALAARFVSFIGIAAALALLPALLPDPSLSAQSASCLPPISNPIACENALVGNPQSEWDVTGAGDTSIQGFATDISVNHGQTVTFKVKTDASNYRIDIYRLGYYGGAGARKVATVLPSVSLPQTQPNCLSDSATGLVDCGNWTASASWSVPSAATSGVYIGRLVRTDNGGASHMVFIVRDDDNHSDLLFQAADTTWQAYNDYGGNSLYVGSPAGRAYKVSYNRPFVTRGNQFARAWLFDGDYPMIRWLEANGYFVSYTTGIDSDRRGAELLEHKAFLSVGHDEYWSGGQRTNVEAARAAGVHLAFFSGDEVFWKTRWENSISSPATSYRTLVSYKETHANAKIDPTSTWTGTWRDARFSPPSDGGQPENALTGTIFMGNCCPPNFALTVSSVQGKMRFWRNTSAANLAFGQTLNVAPGIIGYEFDADLDNGFRPQGLIRLSTTNINYTQTLLDNGSTFGNGPITHALTQYRHASGALVFGAGLTRWGWALDTTHDLDASTPGAVPTTSPVIQQATVNVLADMGSQPLTLQPGLTLATASADTTGPTTIMTSPTSGSVSVGTPLVMSGTATDSGGGNVAAVEVSLDNGVTWKVATGLNSWSYSFAASGQVGTMVVRSRAIDDSGNIGASASATLTVTAAVCPCTLWPTTAAPAFVDTADLNPIELGLKFRSDTSGYITGIRFYKGVTTTGAHVANLWSNGGALLATGTFINETASGWQQVNFATPVAITANTQYVASYHTNVGNYAYDPSYFQTTGVDRSPLHAPSEPASGGNGVYIYGPSAFPSEIYNANNYWVDVVFVTTLVDSTAPTVTAVAPLNGATGVSPTTTVAVTFSEPMLASTITTGTVVLRTPASTVVPATVSYTGNVATLTPTSALSGSTTYTLTVTGGASGVKDLASNALAANFTASFTTAVVDTTAPTLTSRTPAVGATGVSVTTAVTATFSEALQASTVTTGTVVLRTPASTIVPATVSYAGSVATLTPTSALAGTTTYTATVVGGASGVKDLAGNPLAADVVWTFTTGTAPVTTTLGLTTIAATGDLGSSNALNGSLVTATAAGTVTSMSVYVGALDSVAANQQYQLAIYANNGGQPGALLASSASGTLVANSWNTRPVTASVQAGTSYWLIYNTNGQTVTVNNMSFNTAAVGQGVFANDAAPFGAWPATFPASTVTNAQYSLYATVALAADTTAPTVTAVAPVNGATGISASTTVAVTFSEAMLASSVTTTTVVLRTPALTVVPATVSLAGSIATLTPTSALAASTTYTLTVTGGASGVKDLASNALAANLTASFTTADVTPPTVTTTTPASGATAVSPATTVTATFSEPMLASSITTATVVLRTPASTVVPATVTYAANVATLTPTSALSQGTTYTATVVSGASGVKDVAGNPLATDRVWSFTTSDTTAPTVTAVAPVNGATGVSASTTVAVTFSEAMLASSITTTTVVLRNPALTVVPATVSLAGNLATLTPTSALAASTIYTLTVTSGASGVKDLASNALAANFTASFTTADATPPTVTATTPASGATAVSPATTVTATFSEAMLASSITTATVVLRTPALTVVPATVTYAGNVATLTPTSALSQGTTYTATVVSGASGVKDLSGNPLAIDRVWSFTTADTTAPTVTTVAPVNGATGVSPTTTVAVTFSEAMLASTVTTTTVVLRNPALTVVPATVSLAGNVATLTPTSALAASTTYTLTVTGGASGVKDLASNALAANFTASFTTVVADTTAPTITSRTPAVGATGVSVATPVTATFSEAMLPSSITTATVVLRTPALTVLPATVSYAANVATLTPTSALAAGTTYTATIVGGASGVKDLAGNALAADVVWTFTTAAAPTTVQLGLTTIGATGDLGSSNALNGSLISATSAGTVTSLSVYVGALDSLAANQQYQLAIYANSGGQPGALLASSATGTLVANSWNTLPVTASVQAGTSYWLIYNTNGRTVTVNNMSFNDGTAGQGVFANAAAPFGSWPATFPALTLTTARYSLYATVALVTDTTAPTVSAVAPASGATGVSPSTAVTTTFSEAMLASTITTTTVVLRNPASTVVPATVSLAGNVATLTPTSALAAGTTYTLTVTGGASGVKDLAGNALAANFTATFTTAADTTAPTVAAVAPANGAAGISPSTAVTATFSEAMLASTITTTTVVLRNPASTVVPATVSLAGNVATLTPTSVLAASTTYTLTVTGGAGGVKDLASNALTANFTASFTTAAVDTTAPTVTVVAPVNGATGVNASTTVAVTFSEAMTASTITTTTVVLRNPAAAVVPATVSYAGNVATLTPTSALAASTTYTLTATGGASGVKDLAGNALAANFTASFTTAAAPTTMTLGLTTVGATGDLGSSNALNGSLVTATSAGTVTSLSVYVGALDSLAANQQYQLAIYANNGGQPGALLASSAAGTLVANSWNTRPLTASVQAGTSYWLIYNTNGRTVTVNNMSFNDAGAGQGVFSNAAAAFGSWPSTFPASTVTTARYSLYATVALVTDTTAPTVTAVAPVSGATGVLTSTPVTVTFSEAMLASTITTGTVVLRTPANAVVPATVSLAGNVATLTPTSALAASTTYTLTVTGGASGVKDLAGNALAANFTAAFTTGVPPSCPCSIWPASTTPTAVDLVDLSSIEVGVKFQSDVSGFITGIRFYKAATNLGTHVASLWTTSGTLLASATFTNETLSGWQQVSFASPVAITANTLYIASYHATAGNYAYDAGYFATAGANNGVLHAPSTAVAAGNGVFEYGATTIFPTQTFNGNNYWVDVVFTP